MPAATGYDISELCALDEVTTALADEMTALAAQLAASAGTVTADEIATIVGSPATRLVLAREESTNRLIGMLTVVVVQLPTGLVCRIEDVVVDSADRGRGVGENLIEYAVAIARDAGARFVELTSRPSREAANRLYQRLGLSRRETNVYRLRFDRE